MILNMLHTNRTDDFAIERRTKFNKAIQSKETLSWEETLCNASGEESFHNRKFIPYLMRTAL
jgi:hypothetical protein